MSEHDATSSDLLQNLVSAGFSRSEFLRFLKTRYASAFVPEPAEKISLGIDASEFARFSSCELLGAVRFESPVATSALAVVVVALAKGAQLTARSSRKAQFELAKKTLVNLSATPPRNSILKKFSVQHGLFVFFDSAGNFRLSLVTSEISVGENTRRWNTFRRQSFFVEKGKNARTFVERLSAAPGSIKLGSRNVPAGTLDEFKVIFSVEALTKEFYRDLFAWFEWARDSQTGITFPNLVSNPDDDRDRLEIKIIRLITRIMFVWFIRRKDLVPADLFDENRLAEILKNFSTTSTKSGNYYNAILQNLFFATLNRARRDENGNARGFADRKGERDVKTLYRYEELFKISRKEIVELFDSVPFLNGGLFECLDKIKKLDGEAHYYDGFSRNDSRFGKNKHFTQRAFIPDALFFAPERGLFKIFDRYNFTIDENSPADADISLDPELLGRVFENLLAYVNPETNAQARKATGSFYTPREIVGYMVDEALLAYIGEACDENSAAALREILQKENSVADGSSAFSQKISDALHRVKILDPACGSGAFPMGCLSRIIDILEKIGVLNPDAPAAVYKEKLHLVENCIYGIDIQPIAVQISKLRFFISLVCEARRDEKKDNFGIPTLPNLETKFVCADALVPAKLRCHDGFDENFADPVLKQKKDEIFAVRRDHFYAKTHIEKQRLRARDEALRDEIHKHIVETAQKPNAEKIALCEKQIDADSRELKKFAAKKIVHEDVPEEKDLLGNVIQKKHSREIDANAARRAELEKSIHAAQAAIASEKNKKLPKGFDDAVCQIARWNPYDQNASAEFFDAEWMFGVPSGFDIVIGNPPYIQMQNNGGELAERYEIFDYKTFERTGDIYCLFYERGNALLRDGGHLAFITSNKWMRAGYGEKIRAFFAEKTVPQILVDFAGTKIFEAATVDTNILIFEKCVGKTARCRALTASNLPAADALAETFAKNAVAFTPPRSGASWTILSPLEQSIKQKIEAVGTPLKNWDVSINYGIKTGYNDAFIISTEKRAEILKNCADRAERSRTEKIIRPVLRGRDIKRYSAQWANLWLICTHNGVKERNIPRIDIKNYPTLKAHLDSFGSKVKKRSDQGDTPYNLRNCAYWEDFAKPKIVWTPVNSVYRFSPVPENWFVGNSLFFITGESLSFLCGIFNSLVFQFFFELVLSAGAYAYGSREFFLDVPVPLVPVARQKPIVALVEKILEAKRANADADTSALEREIDALVYALYGLTDEEIALVENRGVPAVPAPAPESIASAPVRAASRKYDPSLDD